jgi:SAM-dependent methyltransferase
VDNSRPPQGTAHRARHGQYGIDAPYVPLLLGLGGLTLIVFAAVTARSGLWAIAPLACGLWLLLSTASYLYTTRAGKFTVWRGLLRDLQLRGDEWTIDVGCGRGAVLLLAAKLLPRGRAVGVDLWSSADQSGNRFEAAQRNAAREGVAPRVELHTADMRNLPFANASFDVVLSSLAIHNISDSGGRSRALEEIARVLRPGGRLLIADFRFTGEYAARLGALGLDNVRARRLSWRFWYGGPWTATTLVTASKPS